MKKLFYKVFAVICIVFIADWFMGLAYNKLLLELPDVGGYEMNGYQALIKDTSDLIILGASHARVDYDAKKIGKAMDMTAYIAGLNRHDFVYNDIVLKSYLRRHKPKIVILDIYPEYICGSMLPERYNHLTHLYGMSEELTASMNESLSWMEKIKYHSNLYKYNNSIPWLVQALFGKDRNNGGFEPHIGLFTENRIHESVDSIVIDSVELSHLNNIVTLCKKNQIKLYVFSAPSFVHIKGFSEWLKLYGDEQQVKVFDYSDSPKFRDYRLFSDVVHLNYDGAQKYTDCVIKDISAE